MAQAPGRVNETGLQRRLNLNRMNPATSIIDGHGTREQDPNGELGLYIHLPFCPARCPYCDFYALPFQAAAAKLLLPAMLTHLERLADLNGARELDTLYLGGGTPSMLPLKWLERLIKTAAQRIGLREGAEVSLEANPGTLSPKKAGRPQGPGREPAQPGGPESTHGEPARSWAGCTARMQPGGSFRQARRAGFASLNLDLIYGLPRQSAEQGLRDLEAALELEPDHVSLYELTLGEYTPFGARYEYGRTPLPSPDELLRFERSAYDRLERAGLRRYEVSNFARPGHECRHNQSTWRGGEYLALGPGAHGHLQGRRWAWVADARRYAELVRKGREPYEFEERLSRRDRALERIMLGLRTVEGVDLGAVRALLGEKVMGEWEPALVQLQEQGWARLEQGFLKPTPLGLSMADGAARLFV